MSGSAAPFTPRFCPNPRCAFHCEDTASWRWVRNGSFRRAKAPLRVQRFRCGHCRRHFSEQTFSASYWLKLPELHERIFADLVACAAYRQIGRSYGISPQTVALHAARLGRHCLLLHRRLCPEGPIPEPLALDSFQGFEFSQYHPTLFHLIVGQRSHFVYGFTDSELRRSGRMTKGQKRRRAQLEREHGRPDPRSIEREVARLLALVAPEPQRLVIHTDEHQDYPRAFRSTAHLEVEHHTISSRAARTAKSPLFAVNLLDLLIRHSGANHKRETIAFSKRRQAAAARLWATLAWRNYGKWFSERKRAETPAMRVGASTHRFTLGRMLKARLFPGRIRLPERWGIYYRGLTPTRRIPNARCHQLGYAF